MVTPHESPSVANMVRPFRILLLFVALAPPAVAQNALAEKHDGEARERFHAVRGRSMQTDPLELFEGELDLGIETERARLQDMQSFGSQWSGNAHLLWDGPLDATLRTNFEVETAGDYDLSVQFTRAVDYGQVDLFLNGEKLGERIDLFSEQVDLAPLKTFRVRQLQTGRQTLEFKLAGHNSRAKPYRKNHFLLGLDYLKLSRVNRSGDEDTRKKPADRLSQTSVRQADPLEMATMRSLMERYCWECHDGTDSEAELNLSKWSTRDEWLSDVESVRRIRDVLVRHQMPPEDHAQLPLDERGQLVATFQSMVDDYLVKNPPSTQVVMRRLNRFEYNNAVRDLFDLKGDIYPLPEKTIRADQPYFLPASGRFPRRVRVGNRTLGKNQVERQILTGVSPFAIDLQAEGGFNNVGSELSISPILVESFLRLGHAILHSPEFDAYSRLSEQMFAEQAGLSEQALQGLGRKRIAKVLERAFRSRVSEETVDRYHQMFCKRLGDTGSFRHSMKDVLSVVLASPRFIYLVESTGSGADQQLLDPYELATRLSFFLWSSIPDENLLESARDRSLLDRQVLDRQITRMLADPRCQALSQNFARQWLRLDQLVTAVPDFDRFPRYYSRIGCEQWKFGLQTMIEPLLLFESIMVEDRSIMLLVDSNYTYRSDELQSWYDDAVPFGAKDNRNRFNTNSQTYHRRQLDDRREGGVITSAATLTMTSAPLRTSPIVRGAWVATVVFNQPPPPPPDSVPPIEADDKMIEAKGLTLRQRLVEHQVNQSCASCHAKIDPLGFALENYDAVGRWRESYASGLAIDASGKLFGQTSFQDAVGLKKAILDQPEWFMRAFSEHLLSYSLGRELQLSDATAVNEMVERVRQADGQFSVVVRSVVHSAPFRLRGREDQSKQAKHSLQNDR
ncbi:MAG: DUF1592 domain-containing protein [Planctomycetaceae bacterium]|nr:DUF1592 domain-containing protein [Planctomycetaceae bacterium]